MKCKICDGLGNIKGETCVVCDGVVKPVYSIIDLSGVGSGGRGRGFGRRRYTSHYVAPRVITMTPVVLDPIPAGITAKYAGLGEKSQPMPESEQQ